MSCGCSGGTAKFEFGLLEGEKEGFLRVEGGQNDAHERNRYPEGWQKPKGGVQSCAQLLY